MRTRIVVMAALALAVALAPRPAAADWDDRPDPSEYEEQLAPNGYWVDEPQFGHVWRPSVDWNWRPYVDGHWVYSDYGWTWASAEPWGWTFHYGRWGWSNLYGWVWTPGYVWGPAWVDWYWGDGFVGWVPVGPPGFAIAPSYWVYVHDYHFCSPRVPNVIVVRDHLPTYVFEHREHGWGRSHPPDYRDIDLVTRHRIERVADRPRDSVAPWVEHRIERGERVRERIADGGQERVVDHPGRGRDVRDDRGHARGDDGRGGFDQSGRVTDGRRDERDHPVIDDGGWRRREDHGGRMSDRGLDGSGERPAVVGRPSVDVDRRRSYGNDAVVIEPQQPRAPGHGWNRPPSTYDAPQIQEAPRRFDRPTPPPQAYGNGSWPRPQIIEGSRAVGGGGAPHGQAPHGQVMSDGGRGAVSAPHGGGGSAPHTGSGGWTGGHDVRGADQSGTVHPTP